jgi:hypothetical protein
MATPNKVLPTYTETTRSTIPSDDTGTDISVSVNTDGVNDGHVAQLARAEISRNVQEKLRNMKTDNPAMWRVVMSERKLAYIVAERGSKSRPTMTTEQVQAAFIAEQARRVNNGEISRDDARNEVLAMFDNSMPTKAANAA